MTWFESPQTYKRKYLFRMINEKKYLEKLKTEEQIRSYPHTSKVLIVLLSSNRDNIPLECSQEDRNTVLGVR